MPYHVEQLEREHPGYAAYHSKVIEACAELMGEDARRFFDSQCDFLQDFLDEQEPEEVAQDQRDAL